MQAANDGALAEGEADVPPIGATVGLPGQWTERVPKSDSSNHSQEEKDIQIAGVVFSKPDANPGFKRSVSNCSTHSDMGGVVLGQCLI